MNIDQKVVAISQIDNATGKMSAKVSPAEWVPGPRFESTSVHFSQASGTVGVLGMMNSGTQSGAQASDPIFIFLAFPDDIGDGDHSIGPYESGTKGVWAYFARSTGGYAKHGSITGLKWDREAGTVQADSFEFEGMAENDQAFSIQEGKFNITYKKMELTGTGSGSASVEPAFMDITQFTANRFEHYYDAEARKGFVTLVEYDEDDKVRTGVRLDFKVVENVVTPDKASFIVQRGVYPAIPDTFSISDVEFNQSKTHIAFKFVFSLGRLESPSIVKGKLDVTRG